MAAAGAKFAYIDRMRGLAILAVIWIHYSQAFASPAIHLIGMLGQLGVQLFFFASAITLCLSADHRAGEYYKGRNFILRRWLRIAPLYYLAIPCYAVYFAARGEDAPYTPGNIMANVLFVHGFVRSANNNIVPGGWSVGVEMAFYVVFPALYRMMERGWRQRGGNALIVAVAGSLAVSGVYQLYVHHQAGTWLVNNSFGFFSFWVQQPVFVIGMAYYLAVLRGGAPPAPGTVWHERGLLIAGWGAAGAIVVLRYSPLAGMVPPLAALGYVGLSQLLRRGYLERRWIEALGGVSYSLYIIHFAWVWGPGAELVHSLNGDSWREWAVLLPLFAAELLGLWLVARIMWKVMEQPFANLASRLISRWENSRKSAVELV